MPDNQPTPSDAGRDKLAGQVVFWSGIGIAVVSLAVVIAIAYTKPANATSTLTTVFNTLIPLFGTWVGTVLAFYFSGKNYEAAAKATKDLVQQFGDERLRQIAVKDVWIAVGSIDAIVVDPGKENTKPFSEIEAKLSSMVSRVPIWSADKVVRYVIHESVIFEFLNETSRAYAKAAAEAATKKVDPPPEPKPTLQDFLVYKSDGTPMQTIVSKLAFVGSSATLADAKTAMQNVTDSQDIFVTDTGDKNGKVLGWITNSDIAKKARA